MNGRILTVAALAAVLALSGCAASQSGSAYERRQARTEQTVRMGVVESVRQVQIEGTKSGVGTIAGGAVGGVAGSTVGQGRGSMLGAIIGAVIGGVAGSVAEEKVTKKPGLEITVKLDNGTMVAVVQEADEQFNVGDRVRILSGQGVSRVTH